ncbi:MAG: MotA/TolQ/ExbB proton channel family protein [Proteobacteria bacterium]|jgi:biopolymer transport protein TolQ|nr:MotA/TolQ/ExbB proton channel family protein [Pseudomonadota bacterium]
MLLFLFEFMAFAAEEAEASFTLTHIWDSSGAIARTVIVILCLMLSASAIVTIERLIAFGRARRQSMRLAAEIVGPLQKGDIAGALKLAKDDQFKAAYLGSLLSVGLQELDLRMDRFGVTNAHRAIEKAHAEEATKLKRGMTILATTGSTAPFVGLFGTTFGVINAFQGMATAGSGLASISAGISEALITTGVGIGVAVLGVWAFNYFNSRTEKVLDELSSSESDFMDWAEKQLQNQSAAAK